MRLSLRNRLKTVCALTTVLVIVLSLFNGGANLRAADNAFQNIANLTVSELKNGSIDLLNNPNETVTYGDTLEVLMSWTIDDTTTVVQDQPYTYQLPNNITFNHSDGLLKNDSGKVLGNFDITDNVITVTYTDSSFCSGGDTNRVGQLRFDGKIVKDNNNGASEGDLKLIFPQAKEITLHMKKPPVESKVSVTKKFVDTSTSHVYDCIISFTSQGSNTNVKIADEMWPGMYLYGSPKYYTDEACTNEIPASRLTDSTPAPAEDVRTIDSVIDAMAPGETLYLKYQVKVFDEMYYPTQAAQKVDHLTNYYPYTFQGNVPNRVTVTSTEDTTGQTVWADIRTYRAYFGKWGHEPLNDFKHGLTGWQFGIYSIKDYGFTEGYILDTLPDASSLVEDSVTVKAGGSVMAGAVSISYSQDPNSGATIVKFEFSKDLMTYLDSSYDAEAWISYQVKVDKQDKVTDRLYNRAQIFYNGVSAAKTGADINYTKPDELTKGGTYTPATAPNANYEINVNPAALDLASGTDDLKLVDTLSSSYDLVVSTVKINGNTPSSSEFSYDDETRTMTFNLKDSTAYVITYSAAVNLVPGSKLDDSNSGNTAMLYADETLLKGVEAKFKCDVYQSAGSSSSENSCVINLTKHEKDDKSKTLDGAEFSLTPMKLSEGTVTSAGKADTATTDANGTLSFGGLTRGTVYMLKEVSAPSGYAADSKPYFYVFETASKAAPTSVTYDGASYSVTVVSSTKISTNIYFSNEKAVPTTPPTDTPTPAPSTTTPTPVTTTSPIDTNEGGSGTGTDDEGKNRTTPVSDPATVQSPSAVPTPTATPTPSANSGSTTKTGEAVTLYAPLAVLFFTVSSLLALVALNKRQID